MELDTPVLKRTNFSFALKEYTWARVLVARTNRALISLYTSEMMKQRRRVFGWNSEWGGDELNEICFLRLAL